MGWNWDWDCLCTAHFAGRLSREDPSVLHCHNTTLFATICQFRSLLEVVHVWFSMGLTEGEGKLQCNISNKGMDERLSHGCVWAVVSHAVYEVDMHYWWPGPYIPSVSPSSALTQPVIQMTRFSPEANSLFVITVVGRKWDYHLHNKKRNK